jgi:hypothetical protein
MSFLKTNFKTPYFIGVYLETRNPELGTWSVKPGTRNSGFHLNNLPDHFKVPAFDDDKFYP